MKFFGNINLGVKTFGHAHRFIAKNKLWLYVVMPGLINITLFIILIIFGWHYTEVISDYVFDKMGMNNEAQGILKLLLGMIRFALGFLLKLIIIFFYFSVYKYIILILMSPFLAILSEKVEEKLSGKKYRVSIAQYWHDVFRGIKLSLRNMLIEFIWIAAFFFVSYIPLFGLVSPFILFVVACYFYGFSMIDYSLERCRLSVKQSARFVRKHKGIAIGNGLMFYVLFLIPGLGLLIAPSYSVTAAAIAVENIESKEKNELIINKKQTS